jgi:hypothetical protein
MRKRNAGKSESPTVLSLQFVFHAGRMNIVVCMQHEVSKAVLQYYEGDICENPYLSASYGMVFVPIFMTMGSGIQLILRLLPRQFEIFQYWYY